MAELEYTVARKMHFFASHNLQGRPVHIHDFEVTLAFVGVRDDFQEDYGETMLINYFNIDRLWKNTILPMLVNKETKFITIPNSSCENLARWIFDTLLSEHEAYANCQLQSVAVFDGDVTVTVRALEYAATTQ